MSASGLAIVPPRSARVTPVHSSGVMVTVKPACRAAASVLASPTANWTCPVFIAFSVAWGFVIARTTTFVQCTDGLS